MPEPSILGGTLRGQFAGAGAGAQPKLPMSANASAVNRNIQGTGGPAAMSAAPQAPPPQQRTDAQTSEASVRAQKQLPGPQMPNALPGPQRALPGPQNFLRTDARTEASVRALPGPQSPNALPGPQRALPGPQSFLPGPQRQSFGQGMGGARVPLMSQGMFRR